MADQPTNDKLIQPPTKFFETWDDYDQIRIMLEIIRRANSNYRERLGTFVRNLKEMQPGDRIIIVRRDAEKERREQRERDELARRRATLSTKAAE